MNTQRIMAIFEKDLKDFMKNTMVIFMPVVPLLLAFLYSRMGGAMDGADGELPLFIVYLVVGATFASIPAGCMMIMMAEEKEKKTFRGLTLSPASFSDIIIGKSLVTLVLTVITLVISLLLVGIEPFLSIRPLIGLVLLFAFFLFIGIGIGLFVNNVGMTTAYLMPIMFIFGFTPMIELFGVSETGIAIKIADSLPVSQLINMHDTNSWLPLGVVLLWVIGAAIFMYVCFIRTQKDD